MKLRCACVVLTSLAAASSAHGADASNITVAETLFRDARELVARGDSATACPKFAESHRLDPKLGTLLNLAACHETLGKTASAWGEFNEARRMAQKQGRTDREQYAAEHAAALEQRLSKVTFESDETVDLVLDDKALGPALLHTPLPLDPGTHALIARRAGRVPVTIEVQVAPGPSSKTVQIPRLEQAPIDLAGRASGSSPAAEPVSGTWRRPVGFVALGVGVVGVGLSAYFGLQAASKHDEGNAHCTGRVCDAEGLDLQSSARTSATVSTIAGGAGIVALGVGAFLVLTAPPRAESRRAASAWSVAPAFGAGTGSVVWRGAF